MTGNDTPNDGDPDRPGGQDNWRPDDWPDPSMPWSMRHLNREEWRAMRSRTHERLWEMLHRFAVATYSLEGQVLQTEWTQDIYGRAVGVMIVRLWGYDLRYQVGGLHEVGALSFRRADVPLLRQQEVVRLLCEKMATLSIQH